MRADSANGIVDTPPAVFGGEPEDTHPGDGDDADDALGVMQQASLAQQVATERKPVKQVKRT